MRAQPQVLPPAWTGKLHVTHTLRTWFWLLVRRVAILLMLEVFAAGFST